MKNLVTYFFILFTLNSISWSQDTLYSPLSYIIAWNTGNDNAVFCDDNAAVYLEKNDSTLIRFNEHYTFFSALHLSKKDRLSPGQYRLLLIDVNEDTLIIKSFHTDSTNEKNELEIQFGFLSCCHSILGSYLFFKNDSDSLRYTDCENIDLLVERFSYSSKKYVLTAVIQDFYEIHLAQKRLDKVKATLIENGISEERFITRIEFRKDTIDYPHTQQIYSPEPDATCLMDGTCEIGIIAEPLD